MALSVLTSVCGIEVSVARSATVELSWSELLFSTFLRASPACCGVILPAFICAAYPSRTPSAFFLSAALNAAFMLPSALVV